MSLEGPSPESAGRLISIHHYPSSSVNYVNPPEDASHRYDSISPSIILISLALGFPQ